MTRLAVVFFTTLILLAIGLMVVMSASNTFSMIFYKDPFYLFNKQFVFVGLGVILMIAFTIIPYQYYKRISIYLLILSILLLALTLFVEKDIKGAKRTLDLIIFSFQPIEFVKLALFIHLCSMIEKMGDRIKSFENGIVYILFWLGGIVLILLFQPNFSSIVMLVVLTFILMFLGGARMKHLAYMILFFFITAGSIGYLFLRHVEQRLDAYISMLMGTGKIHPQIAQAVIALGTGNWQGVGFGGSRQKNLFLSEAHSDFIFAVLGEETGLLGTMLVLILYMVVFVFGLIIAKNAKDQFGRLLGTMISLTVIFYTLTNVAVTTGLLPPTGFALPFMSHGGSSILMSCISIGILLNIGFYAHKQNAIPVMPEEVNE